MPAKLDNITGGGLLPHVYCTSIVLGNDNTVTLNLELLQDKALLKDSAWLNDLNAQGQNFLDSIFIQVLPFRNINNVNRLLPDYNPTAKRGNIYTAKYHLGDNYLPRGALLKPTLITFEGEILDYEISQTFKGVSPGKLFETETSTVSTGGWLGGSVQVPIAFPSPIQVSNSSLLGNIASADAMPNYSDHGAIDEVLLNGRRYYKIPFQHKETIGENEEGIENLGFAYYTFLNVPYWLENLDIGVDVPSNSSFFEEFIIEGPPNTEIVYMNGAPQLTRRAFFLPDGTSWEGSVHLHAEDVNPDPDGYSGTGAVGPGKFTGWMVGESHNPKEVQSKLYLRVVDNNKIQQPLGATEVAEGEFVI